RPPGARGGLPDRDLPLPRRPLARRLLPRRLRRDARDPDWAARHAGAPLPADDAPAAERRARRVGPAARRPRADTGYGRADRAHPRRARADASARRPADLARHVLRLAPAVGVRRGAPPPVDDPPRRARELLRRGSAPLVARIPRPPDERDEGALPVRRLRPR